jgi:hypothetical protein
MNGAREFASRVRKRLHHAEEVFTKFGGATPRHLIENILSGIAYLLGAEVKGFEGDIISGIRQPQKVKFLVVHEHHPIVSHWR